MRSFRRRTTTENDLPEDSYVAPNTISILESHARGENLENEVSSLASDYAREGESLETFFSDLDVLLESAGLPEATSSMLRRAGEAWSVGILERLELVTCEDSLTGLGTTQHLRSVIDGLHRAASEIEHGVVEHSVVVVELVRRGLGDDSRGLAKFAETLRIAMVAEELRAAFTGDEVLVRASDTRCVALVRSNEDLSLRVARIKKAVSKRLQMGPHGFVCRVWIEPVPPTADDLDDWMATILG